MTRTNINIATLYSSAQCVLSVVGSVGVILLFAGIPQLIYSPNVSVANLMTFLLGAILITTMVAGNSFLNYKYRKFTRAAQQNQRDANNTEAPSVPTTVEVDDKPPSYEAILTLDGLPPDYFSILSEKPPRYEDVAEGIFTVSTISPAVPLDPSAATALSSSGNEPPSPVGLESLPNVFQPKVSTVQTGVETSSVSASSSKKQEGEQQLQEETSAQTSVTQEAQQQQTSEVQEVQERPSASRDSQQQRTSVTRLTLGYDNEAYTPQDEISAPFQSVSSPSHLRESES